MCDCVLVLEASRADTQVCPYVADVGAILCDCPRPLLTFTKNVP